MTKTSELSEYRREAAQTIFQEQGRAFTIDSLRLELNKRLKGALTYSQTQKIMKELERSGWIELLPAAGGAKRQWALKGTEEGVALTVLQVWQAGRRIPVARMASGMEPLKRALTHLGEAYSFVIVESMRREGKVEGGYKHAASAVSVSQARADVVRILLAVRDFCDAVQQTLGMPLWDENLKVGDTPLCQVVGEFPDGFLEADSRHGNYEQRYMNPSGERR